MLLRLGAVALLCAALTGCTPGEYKGRVIAGLDDNGALVAVLGVCDENIHAKMTIYTVREKRSDDQGLDRVAEAERDDASVGMRVELRPDEAPDAWTSDLWSIPDHGTIRVGVQTLSSRGQQHQILEGAEIDLATAPSLPDDATKLATEDC
ncbi:hypothetical protein [Actinophytocola sp.]|uniref:hypothetical protein n=1 Tax=Actinophytocola sp. TaxID=1872138 RepID=UPI002ED61D05